MLRKESETLLKEKLTKLLEVRKIEWISAEVLVDEIVDLIINKENLYSVNRYFGKLMSMYGKGQEKITATDVTDLTGVKIISLLVGEFSYFRMFFLDQSKAEAELIAMRIVEYERPNLDREFQTKLEREFKIRSYTPNAIQEEIVTDKYKVSLEENTVLGSVNQINGRIKLDDVELVYTERYV